MKQYRIRPGASFRMGDGSVKGPGDVIELADEVAAQHANAVDEVTDEAAAEPAARADTPAAG